MIWVAIHHIAEHVLAVIGSVAIALTLLIANALGRWDRRRLWLDKQAVRQVRRSVQRQRMDIR